MHWSLLLNQREYCSSKTDIPSWSFMRLKSIKSGRVLEPKLITSDRDIPDALSL